jgi:hypothetical protein
MCASDLEVLLSVPGSVIGFAVGAWLGLKILDRWP